MTIIRRRTSKTRIKCPGRRANNTADRPSDDIAPSWARAFKGTRYSMSPRSLIKAAAKPPVASRMDVRNRLCCPARASRAAAGAANAVRRASACRLDRCMASISIHRIEPGNQTQGRRNIASQQRDRPGQGKAGIGQSIIILLRA